MAELYTCSPVWALCCGNDCFIVAPFVEFYGKVECLDLLLDYGELKAG